MTTQEYRRPNDVVYGYNIGDDIYLTPEGINPNTPIHEYAHLWAKACQQTRPEEWKTLKEELKGNPLWDDVSASDEYAFLKDDEDRLAGEALAKLVGSKGEELLLKAARGAVREGGAVDEADIKKTVEGFRKGLSETAIKDVFGIGELDGASKATLKVLKDFVDCGTGTGLEKNSTVSERNGAVAGYSSSDGLSYHRQGAPKPSSLNSMNDVTNIQKNTDYIKREIKEYRNEHNIVIRRNSENELVRTISRYFNFQKSRSSNSYYQDFPTSGQ